MKRLWLVAAMALAGCGDATAKSWVGHGESELYAARGAPDRSQPIAGGGKVITFSGRNYMNQPVCESSYVIASQGTITSARSNCM